MFFEKDSDFLITRELRREGRCRLAQTVLLKRVHTSSETRLDCLTISWHCCKHEWSLPTIGSLFGVCAIKQQEFDLVLVTEPTRHVKGSPSIGIYLIDWNSAFRKFDNSLEGFKVSVNSCRNQYILTRNTVFVIKKWEARTKQFKDFLEVACFD